ncbi:Cytochrome-c peroxidase [Cellulophaga algicola DSM 14237]|uniref:Cytochrome-c peroxidase n=1 Tax=Cellulophaga algicola (strain DSM 14237 / IC166 / ACAM 630) TaxID=688270 RepID=E6X7M8_CELAD|nr:cytochrome c peroxidase [Cellulophaga algicola]ADV50738.1 Cytochrome-c peroxidase [Cellulophaga algicola DSM 14237]
MKAKTYTLGICLLLLLTTACKNDKKPLVLVTTDDEITKFYTSHLNNCIQYLEAMKGANQAEYNIDLYKKARFKFKAIEPILSAIDKNNYKSLNAPNILQVQEEDLTDVKIRNPFGFQVIEELLFGAETDSLALYNAIDLTKNRLKLLEKNTQINLKDHHLIWLFRNQIVRTATTGITGFDSPVLGQSLLESQITYQTLIDLTELLESKFSSNTLYVALIDSFKNSISTLQHDFDSFDRYRFIQNYTDKQLELLVKVQKDWNVEFPFEMAISNEATSLFDSNTLNIFYFSDYKSDTLRLKEKQLLGKQLFNDKMLSKNYKMACATCHIKDKAFTDGKKTFDGNQIRNTPSLRYAAYQQTFFMDGRSGSLEGQIVGVADNHDEFNLPMDSITNRVLKKQPYKIQFDSLYQGKRMEYNVRHAIASYIRTLNSFDSKFDKNVNGLEDTLTEEEISGFNLFMGKAVCATCHFAPLFNGTVPPDYKDTEMELIGVPEQNDTINALISSDLGRYNMFKTAQRKHFFKTPTVRNVEKTSPYMHNGVYTTLEQVVDFYNRGGGQGIGIEAAYQTLPFDNLALTEKEQASLVAFMKTLTDSE